MNKNDHRSIGQELDLWHFEESAPGMIYWHAPGWALYRQIEDYIRKRMRAARYSEVRSPQLLPVSLWEKSGHWEKFSENMFSVSGRNGEADRALKPMSCPCHVQMFNLGVRSWRDLPMRFCEFGACHRDESSGSLHGLMRTKAFEQDDAHVLCAPDHVRGEVANFVEILREVYAAFGFPDVSVALSLRPEKRAGADEVWDRAESDLLEAAKACGLDPVLLPGEGAFYGPKLEFSLKDRQGRAWQCGTVQLDLVLPGRLGASYVDRDGKKSVPVMLHHAVLGSMGRFIGILLEHHEGRLPFWLAPRQVCVLPISEDQAKAAEALHQNLLDAGVRSVLMDQSESLPRRLVDAHGLLIPVHVVIGKREAEAGGAMVQRDGDKRMMSAEDLVSALSREAERPD